MLIASSIPQPLFQFILFFSSLWFPQEFVQGLSILSRGSAEEKLRWTFSLYDINGDGFITRDEMTDIVTAVYELVGRHPDATGPDVEKIKEKVDKIFMVNDILNEVTRFIYLPFSPFFFWKQLTFKFKWFNCFPTRAIHTLTLFSITRARGNSFQSCSNAKLNRTAKLARKNYLYPIKSLFHHFSLSPLRRSLLISNLVFPFRWKLAFIAFSSTRLRDFLFVSLQKKNGKSKKYVRGNVTLVAMLIINKCYSKRKYQWKMGKWRREAVRASPQFVEHSKGEMRVIRKTKLIWVFVLRFEHRFSFWASDYGVFHWLQSCSCRRCAPSLSQSDLEFHYGECKNVGSDEVSWACWSS